ncbi:MAG: endolytic transglycosylase MltG [Bacteroidaceae bacterium]|nr:endolytic transglycosylase MltG [Bacteroidaceae bacterium]
MDKKRLLSVKYLIPALICLFAIVWLVYYFLFTPLSGTGKEEKLFIDRDDTFDSVMTKLKPIATTVGQSGFATVARHLDYDENIKPGMYILDTNIGALNFVRKLRNGRQDALMVTVPVVRTVYDMARKLDGKLLTDSAEYIKVFTDSVIISSLGYTKETFPSIFIPDTYDFYWTDTPEKLLKRMAKEHDKFWTDERRAKADAIGLTPDQVATLASIVDSETNIDSDKPKVAGVYLNRLKQGMKLQADPTVKFAVGDFTLRRILFKHLTIDSPYNTYKYEGLPPGPICVPSKAGLDAVLNPDKHDYVFFCASPAFDGTHIFASNSEEHMRNARAYQDALNKRKIK